MSLYESQREDLDRHQKKYKEYIDLYKFFNNGSTLGATTFEEWYWRMSHLVRYDDAQSMARSGY